MKEQRSDTSHTRQRDSDCSKDENLKADYEFDGWIIALGQMFTALLDTLVTIAGHDSDEPDAAITVYGEDCRVSIKVGRYVLYTDFTWCRLKTALMLIWTTLILRDDAFHESNHS